MAALKAKLLCRYKACDLGLISFYLSIRNLRNCHNCSLLMTMNSYVDWLIENYHLADTPKAANSLPKLVLTLTKCESKADVRRWYYYRGRYCKATKVEERAGCRLVLR
jgi:hypothetical protein